MTATAAQKALSNLMTSVVSTYAYERPYATIMDLSPEICADMLATSPGNRTIRAWYVKFLAATMKRGEWRVTSQGIGFDILGQYRDGHHRALAVIASGVTIPSVVVFGLSLDAYQVIDQGMKRTAADVLEMPKNVADAFRLGCVLALGNTLPSADQMAPYKDCGLALAISSIVEACPSSRKFFSVAAVKLAAAIAIMDGEDPDFVIGQYRALVALDYDKLTPASKALARQAYNGVAFRGKHYETLARSLCAFQQDRSHITRILVKNKASVDGAIQYVKDVLRKSVIESQAGS